MAISVNEKNVMAFFSENPYNVLGLPCTAQKHDIAHVVSELKTALRSNSFHYDSIKHLLYIIDTNNYTNESVSEAFAKLSNISNKVFAFNSPNYTSKFTLNDISSMLDNIDCYDEFLAGYLWLIENDRRFSHKDMWGKLCNHIDLLMESQQTEWQGYFDNRFSIDELTENPNAMRNFYKAFCQEILLPLKSISSSSQSSQSAREILFEQIASSRVNKYIGGDSELLNLINLVESQSDYEIESHLKSSQENFSLVDEVKEDFSKPDSSISLLSGAKNDKLHPRFYHQENRNEDIQSTEKEQQFTAKLNTSDYKENYNKMDALDMNAPRKQLISPKTSTAEQMTGLVIEGEKVKEIVNNSDGYGYYKSLNQRKDSNLADFERTQFQQKEQKRKRKNFSAVIVLIIVAILAYVAYSLFLA